MTKPRRIFLLAVAVVVIAAAGWHLYATREPSYQGKSLSQWLEEGDSGGCCQTNEMQEVDRAVRAIGKQALPNLLQMLRVKDSWLKVNLMKLGAKQSLIRIPFTSADEHQSRAVIGFRALGQEAREALPELTEILHDSRLASSAAYALMVVGPEAIPILRSALTNQNASIRIAAIGAIRFAGTNGWCAIPDLIQCLQDSSPPMRWLAADALGKFGQDPGIVLPALLKCAQTDSNVDARHFAISAMGSFSNQASALVPALQQMLLSTNPDVIPLRAQLTSALYKIDPTTWIKPGSN